MSHPDISVIIRTYNEEAYLADLLEAIRQQSLSDYEIMVVDSGSWDRTCEIAQRGADKLLHMQSLDFTFGYALNVGIQEAAGRFIVIVSAHTRPLNPQWLDKLIEPLSDEKTAMVYGRQLGAAGSKFSEIQDMRRTFGLKRKVLRPPQFFANNANSAIRKDLWDRHPFDENLLGLEDIEWAKYWMEREYQVVYEPEAALYHIHEESWRQVRRRYYREAVAARRMGIKGFRHALMTPITESANTLFDFARLATSSEGDLQAATKISELIPESILFRANKSIGTVRGLLNGAIMDNPATRRNILFERICNAVVINGPGQAAMQEVEIPEIKPGDVLIRVAYEAVCATDLEIFDGSLGYYKNGSATYPIIPGHEFSGRAVASGPNVQHVPDGAAVVVECIQSCGVCAECQRDNQIACQRRAEMGVINRNGGYAEYVVVPGRFVHCLPDGFDLQKACLCEPLAVALKGLKRLRRTWLAKKEPKRCAVVGAGPLGHMCARVLSLWGHRVTVFDREPTRRGYFEGSDIEVSDDLARLKEFDNLVEVTGSPTALDTILHESPAGATILLLGLPYAHRKFTFESIVAFDKMIVGSVGSSAKHFDKAIELLPQIDLSAFMEKILDFHEFKQGWQLARSHKHLKIILKVT
jgi:2-desacetyl-2-hydroxyethyl bacteriochlorophyllide A dehydrogenase